MTTLVAAGAIASAGQVWGHDAVGRAVPPGGGAAAATLLTLGNLVLVLAAVRTTTRAPVVGRRRRRRLGVHVAVAVAVSVAVAGCEHAAHALVPWAGEAFSAAAALQHVPGYGVTAALAHAWVLAHRLGRARMSRARLARSLARAGREQAAAELRAAKAELHPLLVARALETAMAMVREDAAAAERVVVELGALMREAVAAADVDEVTLGEETDAAHDRAGGAGAPGAARLAFEVEDDARVLLVPHLVVPALVACAEDAGGAGGAGRPLVLRARLAADDGERPTLELTLAGGAAVEADPDGHAPGQAAAGGAAVLRRRLERLYGADAQLVVRPARSAAGGAVVRLTLPARSDETAPPPAEVRAVRGGGVRHDDGRVLEEFVVNSSNAAGVGAARLSLDAVLAAAMAAVLLALHWRRVTHAHGGDAVAGPVLLTLAVYAGLLAMTAATAVVVTRRYPVGGDASTPHAVRTHLAAALAVAALDTAARAAARAAFGPALASWGPPGVRPTVLFLLAGVLMYAVFAGVAHVVVLGRERRRGARFAAQLRAAHATRTRGQASSELRALKAELNPHFVGNALHTAAVLVRRDAVAAVRVLEALRGLAAAAGARVDTQEVSLAEELAGLEPFLALERARLGAAGGTLAIRWDIAADAFDAAVPHLVLQPLAENAVRHGLAPRGGAGQLVVSARRAGSRLVLAVVDDGVGLDAAAEGAAGSAPRRAVTGGVGAGAGLAGVRRRLALLYGGDARVVLATAPGGGAVAQVTLPYRPAVVSDGTTFTPAAAGG